ncbi:double-strand break repair helicase AddA [Hyphococcus flavus]|uniref:DNA 3'-5' helicase n=1 Tax=Hyphococcus flavus TaxID=1866326 RepID=A0AAE9ZF28_9PROT|nr:double-strand break repair helicase AddA [Hyphococcus flavus]WDI32585.1 double-strand break repair helicase AddA [Hyphococcus flavus]
MTPFEQTVANQRIAATPSRSSFVMANAGSGKTRVLTNRVARLLLDGVDPEKILCITFTKAAAAEMADRLFSVLGDWALATDAQLMVALEELEGARNERAPDDLAKARRLFARALETPGGLKIQTIHSFCESVLRRFPLEAGAPPGFTVLEDADGFALINAALDRVARDAGDDPVLAAAFSQLSGERNEDQLRGLLIGAAAKGAIFEQASDCETQIAQLAQALKVNPPFDAARVKDQFLSALDVQDLKRAHDGLAAEGKKPQDAAKRLAPYFSTEENSEKWLVLENFLLTSAGTPYKQLATNATDKHDPWVKPYLQDLLTGFDDTVDNLKALKIFQDTAAHWRLTAALREQYNATKSFRAVLDFDDLILRTRALFMRAESAWVMYKLDFGIEHILLDEAQDTSPEQWSVIESLFEEFFSGAGAREVSRSFFAVGDLKQSIYSFQGADVDLFKQKEQELGEKLAQVTDYKSVPLNLSFRTTAPVLSFVDSAFADKQAAEGLGDVVPVHGVKRDGEAGVVELWPLTPYPEKPEVNPWDAPVDAPVSNHPVRVLCDRVASTIKDWIDKSELLESQGRAVRPGDILILVQSRGKLFTEIISRLSALGVPVAGPDRLKLNEDPAVEDLISYARFALCASDDLSLAEVLKSPLYGFDDDTDLFPLAYDREKHETLWKSLRRRANEHLRWRSAVDEISAASAIGKFEGPLAFLNHVIDAGETSGRKRFYQRLGKASSDAVDELLRQALDFENSNPRSLRAFVDWFDRSAADIKREMERENDSVRVMTAHGAKGLEAEIVFLLDAHRDINTRNIGPLISLKDCEGRGLPPEAALLVNSKSDDIDLTERARENLKCKDYEEYRRLFYVAATRAKDRLYICGVESGKKSDPHKKPVNQKTWHALAEDAFGRLVNVSTDSSPFWEEGGGVVRRISCDQSAPVKKEPLLVETPAISTPSWLFQKAGKETLAQRLTPSKLGGEEEIHQYLEEADGSYSPLRGHDKYFRGRVLHRLLELLPEVAEQERLNVADRLLGWLADSVDLGERERWRDEVLKVLHDPSFAKVFAPGSMAEVPIAGTLGAGDTALKISGQIDRLVVSESQVFVVDYKTNRPPPQVAAEIDPSYVAQMAAYRALVQEIYSGHEIICGLLWTYDARLMMVPKEMLDHAAVRAGIAG